MRKILAPIDLSAEASAPVNRAIGMASALRAELTLLHVSHPDSPYDPELAAWPSDALAANGHAWGDVRRIVLPGNPAETICGCAEFIDADLILMTTDNYGRWRSIWKHSVTGEVMKRTTRNVCIADPHWTDIDRPFRCRRILCYLHLDGTDDPVLAEAESLAIRCGAELILMNVVPEISEGMLLEVTPRVYRPLSRNQASQFLAQLGKRLSVPHKELIMMGSADSSIRSAVRKHAVDLVVAARPSTKRSQPYSLDIGSVLQRLPCPLLAIGKSGQVRKTSTCPSEMTHATVL